jgi:NAD(P)-dependent dehydrogenase (short-subunit alcohol dehydrogenase family)
MKQRFALVTGASTGIGRACALYLDRNGWTVFAGVRKDADGRDLARQGSERLVPVHIDVTDEDSTNECAAGIAERTRGNGLYGLVNNAGISVQGPLEYLPLDQLRNQLEVNIIGQLAVTQALLPLVREAGGRIVFVSSIAGRASALPLHGPYSASKRGLEALVESLRQELLAWNIPVVLVEPGAIATPIWEKGDASFDDIVSWLPEEGKDRYLAVMNRARKIAAAAGRRSIPPEKVAEVVGKVLTSSRPRFRYVVGVDAKARAWLEPLIPNFVRERIVTRVLGYRT